MKQILKFECRNYLTKKCSGKYLLVFSKFLIQTPLVRSDKVLPDRLEKAKRLLMDDSSIVITSADKGGKF